ncbi:MAG: hypothetical protein AAF607_01575 [Pseudomonadota bacterium]
MITVYCGCHSLKQEGDECGILLNSELTVTVGDEKRTLDPREAY